jgi:hypothetical protein
VLATIGVLSPANRGALETCILVFYVCLGSPAGYVSARLYKGKLLENLICLLMIKQSFSAKEIHTSNFVFLHSSTPFIAQFFDVIRVHSVSKI